MQAIPESLTMLEAAWQASDQCRSLCESMYEHNRQLIVDLKKRERNVKEWNTRYLQLHEDYEQREQKMSDLSAQVETFKSHNSDLCMQLEALTRDSEQANSQLQDVRQEADKLREQLKRSKEARIDEHDRFDEETKRLKDICKEYEIKLAESTLLVQAEKERCRDTTEKETTRLTEEAEKLKHEIEAAQSAQAELTARLSDAEQANAILRQQVRGLKAKCRQFAAEKCAWNQQIDELQIMHNEALLEVDDAKRVLGEQTALYEQTVECNRDLRQQLEQHSERDETLSQQISDLQTELLNTKQDMESWKSKFENLEVATSAVHEELQALKGGRSESQEEFTRVRQEFRVCNKDLTLAGQKINQLEEQLRIKSASEVAQMQKLANIEAQLAKTLNDVKHLEEKCRSLECSHDEVDDLLAAQQDIMAQLSETKCRLIEKERQFSAAIEFEAKARLEVASLKERLRESLDAISTLEHKLAAAQMQREIVLNEKETQCNETADETTLEQEHVLLDERLRESLAASAELERKMRKEFEVTLAKREEQHVADVANREAKFRQEVLHLQELLSQRTVAFEELERRLAAEYKAALDEKEKQYVLATNREMAARQEVTYLEDERRSSVAAREDLEQASTTADVSKELVKARADIHRLEEEIRMLQDTYTSAQGGWEEDMEELKATCERKIELARKSAEEQVQQRFREATERERCLQDQLRKLDEKLLEKDMLLIQLEGNGQTEIDPDGDKPLQIQTGEKMRIDEEGRYVPQKELMGLREENKDLHYLVDELEREVADLQDQVKKNEKEIEKLRHDVEEVLRQKNIMEQSLKQLAQERSDDQKRMREAVDKANKAESANTDLNRQLQHLLCSVQSRERTGSREPLCVPGTRNQGGYQGSPAKEDSLLQYGDYRIFDSNASSPSTSHASRRFAPY